MGHQMPITVRAAVHQMQQQKFVLPAIQREFVWEAEQIATLFDSLLQGYPIGGLLLWQVNREKLEDHQFYDFVREYHERDARHNPKADLRGRPEIVCVLDGQQRLTSLFIGLLGTFAYKLPNKRRDNDKAYPKRRLYLNLAEPDQSPRRFLFKFLTEEEAKQKDSARHWFLVGQVLDFKMADISQYLAKHGLATNEFAGQALSELFQAVLVTPSLPNYVEEEQDMDRVLNIFIRINSGGTPLSYSDLLLSIATANWEQRDAREEITGLVDELNAEGGGFDFDKDFVMKSLLVLNDCDVQFKVTNFNKANVALMEKQWERAANALRGAVRLASSMGFSADTLPSNYVLIPVAYHLFRHQPESDVVRAARFADDRKAIRKWILLSTLKRTFGGSPDTLLRQLREIQGKAAGDLFPFKAIQERLAPTSKSLKFGDEEINALLDYEFGQGYTFATLALLYPTFDFRNRFHIDHIHPRSLIDKRKLAKRKIPEDKWDFYLENRDRLANLQLLDGTTNQEKSCQDFKSWLTKAHADSTERTAFLKVHHTPQVDFSFEAFPQFMAAREGLLKAALRNLIDE